ncbi:hypothetical protein KDA14_04050, partial [Candidatus Saccharibacteria bacterium]|nr:hypothetical protein [Candidatus Saccharibacteria bacterium]
MAPPHTPSPILIVASKSHAITWFDELARMKPGALRVINLGVNLADKTRFPCIYNSIKDHKLDLQKVIAETRPDFIFITYDILSVVFSAIRSFAIKCASSVRLRKLMDIIMDRDYMDSSCIAHLMNTSAFRRSPVADATGKSFHESYMRHIQEKALRDKTASISSAGLHQRTATLLTTPGAPVDKTTPCDPAHPFHDTIIDSMQNTNAMTQAYKIAMSSSLSCRAAALKINNSEYQRASKLFAPYPEHAMPKQTDADYTSSTKLNNLHEDRYRQYRCRYDKGTGHAFTPTPCKPTDSTHAAHDIDSLSETCILELKMATTARERFRVLSKYFPEDCSKMIIPDTLFRRYMSILMYVNFTTVVMDETHVVANCATLCHMATRALSANMKIMNSGTFIQNSLEDLRSILNCSNFHHELILQKTFVYACGMRSELQHVDSIRRYRNERKRMLVEKMFQDISDTFASSADNKTTVSMMRESETFRDNDMLYKVDHDKIAATLSRLNLLDVDAILGDDERGDGENDWLTAHHPGNLGTLSLHYKQHLCDNCDSAWQMLCLVVKTVCNEANVVVESEVGDDAALEFVNMSTHEQDRMLEDAIKTRDQWTIRKTLVLVAYSSKTENANQLSALGYAHYHKITAAGGGGGGGDGGASNGLSTRIVQL